MSTYDHSHICPDVNPQARAEEFGKQSKWCLTVIVIVCCIKYQLCFGFCAWTCCAGSPDLVPLSSKHMWTCRQTVGRVCRRLPVLAEEHVRLIDGPRSEMWRQEMWLLSGCYGHWCGIKQADEEIRVWLIQWLQVVVFSLLRSHTFLLIWRSSGATLSPSQTPSSRLRRPFSHYCVCDQRWT